MIKAVLFDVDGVLVDAFDANLKFFQDILVKAGYPLPAKEQFPKNFHLTMFDTIKMLTKSTSEEEVQRMWEIGNTREVPYRIDLMKIPQNRNAAIRTLSKMYRLGIVTSRIRNGVFDFPEAAKIQKYFSTAIAYEDTSNHKPNPEPLLLAAKQMNVAPNDVVYIGDVDDDIQAARAAGMKVIIYSKTPFDTPDGYTSSFKALPKLIKSLHG